MGSLLSKRPSRSHRTPPPRAQPARTPAPARTPISSGRRLRFAGSRPTSSARPAARCAAACGTRCRARRQGPRAPRNRSLAPAEHDRLVTTERVAAIADDRIRPAPRQDFELARARAARTRLVVDSQDLDVSRVLGVEGQQPIAARGRRSPRPPLVRRRGLALDPLLAIVAATRRAPALLRTARGRLALLLLGLLHQDRSAGVGGTTLETRHALRPQLAHSIDGHLLAGRDAIGDRVGKVPLRP